MHCTYINSGSQASSTNYGKADAEGLSEALHSGATAGDSGLVNSGSQASFRGSGNDVGEDAVCDTDTLEDDPSSQGSSKFAKRARYRVCVYSNFRHPPPPFQYTHFGFDFWLYLFQQVAFVARAAEEFSAALDTRNYAFPSE